MNLSQPEQVQFIDIRRHLKAWRNLFLNAKHSVICGLICLQ